MNKDEQWLLDEKYGGTENEAYEADKERFAAGEPLAYVIGSMPFLGLTIWLDSHPLIPRPETEWWTEQLIAELKQKFDDQPFSFLDLCAGSGAIGCAILAAFPRALVSFGELMPEHHATILKNIDTNGLDMSRAQVRTGDLFTPFEGMTFAVIATNPPYIPEDRVLEDSVTQWEPKEALRSGTDGLDLIKSIAREARGHMAPGGMLWLECDSKYASQTLELLKESGATSADIRSDQYGRPRIVVGYYP